MTLVERLEHMNMGTRYLLAGALSATVWWLLTRIPYVPFVILGVEAVTAWMHRRTPPSESVVKTFSQTLLAGGTWAAIGLLTLR
jgi:hypothetical protein